MTNGFYRLPHAAVRPATAAPAQPLPPPPALLPCLLPPAEVHLGLLCQSANQHGMASRADGQWGVLGLQDQLLQPSSPLLLLIPMSEHK